MTMIDPFSHHQNLNYYSSTYGMSKLQGYDCNYDKSFLLTESSDNYSHQSLVDFPMAPDHDHHHQEEAVEEEQEESRTTESLNEPAPGSTSKDFEQDGGWLKLGLGRQVTNKRDRPHDPTNSSSVTRPGLLELTLLPAGGNSQSQPSTVMMSSAAAPYNYMNPSTTTTTNSLMFQQPPTGVNYYPVPRHQDLNFVFRPTTTHDNIPSRNFQSLAAAAAVSNYNFPPTSGSNYFTRPFPQLRPAAADVAGPSFDFRVISPPRRPHSGLWFILQASQTQSKEPFLPQIPKSYLRIKDGRMTVRSLMKYLVNKLKLSNESEIEIRCRNQQLVPFLTLQYVRDNIWRSRDLPRDSSSSSSSSSPAITTTDHVMILHYSRISTS
ncbi:protein LAX PANICLE 2 [Impatiens glandulifera]|uniref:protein LAX PANICLE 2 n=1 Tax=Impatiens glandulifera TaxID=253017 RepID=UPI001FB122D2|nr:protein LAX PANICLE 2 [Impatiens glandulifera]